MRPGALAKRGLGYEDLKAVNPKIVFCTISGYGATGPYRDLPSHGIAYDTWAGLVPPEVDEDGFTRHPRACPTIGINVGPAARRPRPAGRDHPGPGDRRGLPDGDRPVRRRRRHRLVPDRDLAGLRAPRGRGHRQRVRRLRAPGARHRRHAGGRALPDLRVGRRPRALHGLRAGVLEELLRGHRPSRPVRALARARSTPTTPGATSSCRPSLEDIFRPRPRPSGWPSRDEHNTRSPRSTRPRRSPTTRSSRTASRSTGVDQLGADSCRCPIKSSARSSPCRPWPPTVGQHTDDVLRDVLGYDDARIAELRAAGTFGSAA